ncbi:MAG: hypothetical protein K1X51_13445 [Rhodospirillaceae bacterium]|nr:hypothetical protein [Rhodospirillaceae bacterium]
MACAFTLAWLGQAKAADVDVDLDIPANADCTKPTLPSDKIKPGTGKLTFKAREGCTFLWVTDTNQGGPTPSVKRGANELPVTVDGERKTFWVTYDFPTEMQVCLDYAFYFTKGSNDFSHIVGTENSQRLCSDAPPPK